MNRAEEAVRTLADAGAEVAVAESLTGGLVCATLTEIDGSSAVFPGGIVTYAVAAKADVLGVPDDLLAEHGPVHPAVGAAMAGGVAKLFSTRFGVATTGVAGPQAHGGFPPGVVVIGWFAQGVTGAFAGRVPGSRAEVRRSTAQAALRTVTQCVVHGRVIDELLPPCELFPDWE